MGEKKPLKIKLKKDLFEKSRDEKAKKVTFEGQGNFVGSFTVSYTEK